MLKKINHYFSITPLAYFIVFSLTLGLAPFNPPHIIEKLQFLFEGQLTKAVDIFDFFYHGLPWAFLIIKLKLVWNVRKKKI